MDWAKAKSVLIVIFLALNIFLASNLGMQKIGNNASKEVLTNTVEILNKKEVTFECQIPSYNGYGATVTFDVNGTPVDKLIITSRLMGESFRNEAEAAKDNEIIHGTKRLQFGSDSSFTYKDSNPAEKLNITGKEKAEKYVSELIKDLKLPVNSKYILYKSDSNADNSYSVTFVEKYNDFLIFNNSVEATVSSSGIHSLDYKFRKIGKNGFVKDTEKVLPAYQILLKNFNSGSKTVITNIDLGFSTSKASQDTKGLLESPVWRIKTKDSPVPLDFNAYTGAAIR